MDIPLHPGLDALVNRIRVFIASSLDGFIAGPNDELDWLSGGPEVEDTFGPFFVQIGAMLMGRRTYDVVSRFDGDWPYGDTPVLVATSRPLAPKNDAVRAVQGDISALVRQAKATAGDRDVYLDGGALIRSAMEAGLIDEVTVTVIPVILGEGRPLFAGLAERRALELLGSRSIGGGFVELRYRV